jgi:hypothetical protein
LFVADHGDQTADLTVVASLKKDAMICGLDNPKSAGVEGRGRRSKCHAVCADPSRQTPSRRLTDVQGYDDEVSPAFLAFGVKPTMIRFEHCHTPDRHWMRSIASLSTWSSL